MTVEIIDGIRVLKFADHAHRGGVEDDTLTMVHIWRLLTEGHDLHDTTMGPRRFL